MKAILPSYFSKDSLDSDQPLLDEKTDIRQTQSSDNNARRRSSSQRVFNALSILYFVLTIPILVILLYRYLTTYVPYSPVNSRLEYERQPLYEDHDDLVSEGFIGDPHDTEPNWRRLLEPMNFQATPDELHQAEISIDPDIVRVSGGGHVGVLSVFHELHCLEALRKSTLRSYYYANLTNAGLDHDDKTIEHLTHCIEYIRRTVMCHADVSVYAARWIADSHEVPNKDLVAGGDRMCVKWDSVDKWSRERALLKHVYKVKPGPYEKDLNPN